MSPENNLISQAVDSGIGVTPKSSITLSNSIERVSDIDLYRFQLEQGQGITLDIDTVNKANNNDFDSYLRVFDAEGQELAFNDDFSEESEEFSLDSYIGFIANTTGEYFVGVSNVANQDYNPIDGANINRSTDNFVPSNYNLTLNIVEVVADDDSDNTIAEAIDTAIATTADSLATIKGEINNNSDVDIYSLQLGQDEGIRINLNAQAIGSELDSWVRLFDAEGNELALNNNSDDPNNITTDLAIAFAPHVTGEYFVGVSSAGNFDYDPINGNTNLNLSPSIGINTGTYELKLDVLEVVADDDPDNTISEALNSNQIAADSTDKVISEQIESVDDVDLIKFELGQGEGVALEITTEDSELDSLLRLFDAAGNELTVDDNNDANFNGESSTDSYLRFLPETPGEYYVGVGTSGSFDYDPVHGRTNFSSNVISPSSTTGSYQLGINIIEVVADDDPDNTLAEAVPSGVSSTDTRNVSLTGEIDLTSDVDVYHFQLQEGDGITIDLNTTPDSTLDSYLRLFDPEGNEIAFDNNEGRDFVEDSSATDSLLTFTTDISGEYFVGVSSNGNSEYDAVNGSNNFTPTTGFTTGSYDLSLNIATIIADSDADNTIKEAITGVISSGQKSNIFKDAIDSDTDVDLYQLQLNQGEVVDLDIDTGEFDSNLDSILQVFDANGKKLAFNDDSRIEDEFNRDSALVFTAPTDGQYYVGVSSFDNFDYDPLNGNDNFSGDLGSTTGEYQLAIAITEMI